MAMSGTLEEVLEKIYELFMENRINVDNTIWFLSRLKHENGEAVFGKEDALKVVNMLIKDKGGEK
jgi:hypothetical protein